jgi:hypothetical protein
MLGSPPSIASYWITVYLLDNEAMRLYSRAFG